MPILHDPVAGFPSRAAARIAQGLLQGLRRQRLLEPVPGPVTLLDHILFRLATPLSNETLLFETLHKLKDTRVSCKNSTKIKGSQKLRDPSFETLLYNSLSRPT